MDPTIHTLIAVGALAIAFYAGKIITAKSLFEDIAVKMLDGSFINLGEMADMFI